MSSKSSAGGAGALGGSDFQARVAAWFAVQILAETGVQPPFKLGSGVTLERLRGETGEGIDDLLVETSEGGYTFIQAKRRLDLSTLPGSPLAATLHQFVRQSVAEQQPRPAPGAPWHRPLEPGRDRLVLVVGSRTPSTIRFDLEAVMRRAADLAPGQPLAAAAVNANERQALHVAIRHLQASWRSAVGAEASEEELCRLLSLAHVQFLAMDEGEAGEVDAKNLLRQTVLREPAQADAAWALLLEHCTSLCKERTGTDRATLQRVLLLAGIRLEAAQSYRADIRRLLASSSRMLSVLRDLAVIRVGEAEVKFDRHCVHELRRAGEDGSLLVIGEPGAGKSGALHDLAVALGETRDVVVLVVDRLEAPTIPALNRELGIEHDLVEVLANWPGTEPAWLIVDALDAARAEPAARTLRDLFHAVAREAARWRVVSSIRKFDLRHSPELQKLFAGTPPSALADPEFAGSRHVEVRRLAAEELAQIGSQSPALTALAETATPELWQLVTVAFNLRLAGELVGEGVEVAALAPIRTQLELLNRYWQQRVVRHDGQGDAREAVLRRACESMIELRQLRAPRANIVEAASSAALHELLGTHVLAEWQPSPASAPDRYVLTFPHHALFDYAVARLVLRGEPAGVVARLTAEPDLVLIVRPSLELHFEDLWALEPIRHELFWDTAFRLAREERIPELGKLIGPAVAARRASRLADLAALIERLESARDSERESGEVLLRHVIGALVALPADSAPLVGASSGPWCELLERLSRTVGGSLAYSLRPLLHRVCETPTAMSPAEMSSAGQAARHLLEFSWRQTPRDAYLVLQSIDLVCSTFEGDAAASAALIRQVLDPTRSEFRFEELPCLARQVPRLIALDAALVQEIYGVTYRHRETSTAPTNLLASNILPLASHRRQDFDMAHYELGNAFPQFLAQQPRYALRALNSALDAMMEADQIGGCVEVSFDFDGRQAKLRTDQSYHWDVHEEGGHWPAAKLLETFERHLESLAAQYGSREALREIVGVVVEENCLAVVWRRLLRQAARFPDSLGREILPAVAARPILTLLETSHYAGEYLRAAFAGQEASDRERIERVLMALPEDGTAHQEEARDRLLGCLPVELLVTDPARDHLAALHRIGGVPPNEPPFQMTSHVAVLWPVSAPSSPSGGPPLTTGGRVTALTRSVQELIDRGDHQPPGADDATAIVPRMRELVAALADCEAGSADASAVEAAWHALATAAARIASREDFFRGDETGALVSSVLLSASCRSEPRPRQEIDGQFDESLSYFHPAPRVEGARGLLFLARHVDGASAEVLERIDSLSHDPVPAVRLEVASRINLLYDAARAEMWAMLERICREETNQAVLAAVVNGPLDRLASPHSARITDLVLEILARFGVVPESRQIRRSGTNLLARIYLGLDDPASRTATLHFAAQPKLFPDEASELAKATRAALRHGLTDDAEPAKEGVRSRARDLLLRVLRSAKESRDRLIADHEQVLFDAWPKEDKDAASSLTRLLDQIAIEIYHASGAFRPSGSATRPEIPDAGRKRFYQETGLLMDELAEIGLASVAHHLLKTLESFISFDPAGVFVRMARVVGSGRRGHYQFEAMAADLIVRVVERYLAEYRYVFREDEACRAALLEILNTFVRAGWPSARQLDLLPENRATLCESPRLDWPQAGGPS